MCVAATSMSTIALLRRPPAIGNQSVIGKDKPDGGHNGEKPRKWIADFAPPVHARSAIHELQLHGRTADMSPPWHAVDIYSAQSYKAGV
jgi:hypothetical protein